MMPQIWLLPLMMCLTSYLLTQNWKLFSMNAYMRKTRFWKEIRLHMTMKLMNLFCKISWRRIKLRMHKKRLKKNKLMISRISKTLRPRLIKKAKKQRKRCQCEPSRESPTIQCQIGETMTKRTKPLEWQVRLILFFRALLVKKTITRQNLMKLRVGLTEVSSSTLLMRVLRKKIENKRKDISLSKVFLTTLTILSLTRLIFQVLLINMRTYRILWNSNQKIFD